MENLRQNDEVTANTALLQNNFQPQPIQLPDNSVTYAQIVRPIRPPDNTEQFDFRLQTPQQQARSANFVDEQPPMSGGSSISSGYIDLTQNLNRRNVRPTSPETSF